MDIFSWPSGHLDERDRSRDGDEYHEQPVTPMDVEYSPVPVGEQQSTAPIDAGHSSAPVGEQRPEALEGEAASSKEEPRAPTFTDFTVRPITIERLDLPFDSFG